MASIAEWIEKIKTAIYGEEVRGAIWQSLDAMNTQVDAINVDSAQIEQNKQNIATNTAAITTLNSRIAVAVTAGENVTIDINKSYAVGKMLFLSVKGHASADVTNAELFTISGVTPDPTNYTFFCGVGAEWSLTGIGYCYVNVNKITGRITSGQYFHICVTIPIN